MIEIGTDVELFHPTDRVWRALTDQALLGTWLAEATVVPDTSGRLLLRAAGLPGFNADVEAEVVQRRAPELLMLRCREGRRRTLLTAALVPTGHGCRLSVRETLEQGEWDTDRRAEHHQQAIGVRLPAILDWLAFQQVDLRRAEGARTAELPLVRARTGAGRRRALVAGTVVCATLVGGVAMWAARPTPPAPASPPEMPPLVLPSARGRTPDATGSRPARATRSTSAAPRPAATPNRTGASAPPAAPLTARYRTISDRVFGYRGEVVVANPGSAPKERWTVVVTMGAGATIGSVNGAEATQDGAVVTFTGPAVPAGGSTTFRFDVRDPDPLAKAPDGCMVGGAPCAGW